LFTTFNLCLDLLKSAESLTSPNKAVSVCRFAEVIEDDDTFNSESTDLKFEDLDKLEFLQVGPVA